MDDLDEMLRRTAPSVSLEGGASLAHDVAAEVAARSRGPRPSRRRRRTLLAGAIGAVLIPATAAAAVIHFKAETGRFGSPGMTENDTSQVIDMCASDIHRYVATLEPTSRPLPPGVTWTEVATKYIATAGPDCPPNGPGETAQVTGIKESLLEMSSCPWEKWALSAPTSTQAVDLRRADTQLADIQVAIYRVSPRLNSDWKKWRDQYADASEAFLAYDYQVNCLGRDTASNPPTVPDPDQ